jgi:hypothetical protein
VGELVKTLRGPDIAAKLREAYVVLARAYLNRRAGDVEDAEWVERASSPELYAAVMKSEGPIDLSAAILACEWVGAVRAPPAEVFNQLCHMSVLIAAADVMAALGLVPNISAPTQQAADEAGRRIPDLGGDGWFLEAYGGVCYKNNGKLAKDLRALKRCSDESGNARLFLACRLEAWSGTNVSRSESVQITHRCPKIMGGPYRAVADARLFHDAPNVRVVEILDVSIDEGSPTQDA